MRLLPHAAGSLSAFRYAAFRSAHLGLGDSLRLSAVVGHAPDWAGPRTRDYDAFRGLAFRAFVPSPQCRDGFGHAGLYGFVRWNRGSAAARSARLGGVPGDTRPGARVSWTGRRS